MIVPIQELSDWLVAVVRATGRPKPRGRGRAAGWWIDECNKQRRIIRTANGPDPGLAKPRGHVGSRLAGNFGLGGRSVPEQHQTPTLSSGLQEGQGGGLSANRAAETSPGPTHTGRSRSSPALE